MGCQQRQQRWEGGRRCHVSAARRSSSVRKARARMVATEGSRVSMSPEKPSSSSSSVPQAAAALVSKAGEEQAAAAAAGTTESARTHRLRVTTFFFLWYTFNVGYNLCTKFT